MAKTQLHRPDLPLAELTEKVIGIFYEVYNELGYGFLESVYQRAMAITLEASGLRFRREYPIPVWFRGIDIGSFKADFLVEEQLLLELKTAERIERAYEAQTLNYLRATKLEIALLPNFGPSAEFRRLAYGNERKKIRVYPRASAATGSV